MSKARSRHQPREPPAHPSAPPATPVHVWRSPAGRFFVPAGAAEPCRALLEKLAQLVFWYRFALRVRDLFRGRVVPDPSGGPVLSVPHAVRRLGGCSPVARGGQAGSVGGADSGWLGLRSPPRQRGWNRLGKTCGKLAFLPVGNEFTSLPACEKTRRFRGSDVVPFPVDWQNHQTTYSGERVSPDRADMRHTWRAILPAKS